jgi:hypothetical protein
MSWRTDDNVPMMCGLVDVKLPDSLHTLFNASALRRGVTDDEAITCLIDAITDLNNGDLLNLVEPRKERRSHCHSWSVGRDRKRAIDCFSSENGLSSCSLLRRILYAILVTKEIAVINSRFEPGMRLQRMQMHLKFL